MEWGLVGRQVLHFEWSAKGCSEKFENGELARGLESDYRCNLEFFVMLSKMFIVLQIKIQMKYDPFYTAVYSVREQLLSKQSKITAIYINTS